MKGDDYFFVAIAQGKGVLKRADTDIYVRLGPDSY